MNKQTQRSTASETSPAAGSVNVDENALVAALLAGDEAAFATLIDRFHATMVRLATLYVGDRRIAEEVAQEAWLGVLRGLGRFEGRSSLKTWIFTILTNRAKTHAQREGRQIPFSDLAEFDDEPSVPSERFRPPDAPEWANHWLTEPAPWETLPEERLLSRETREQVQKAIDTLPAYQREVITLRDLHGWSSAEVCNVLGISEANQRVLLHRARSKVRLALEKYFAE